MATTPREERKLLSHEEFFLVQPSHYPAIKALVPKDLRGLAARLRDHHDRARDMMRSGRRGKAEPRAASAASARPTRLPRPAGTAQTNQPGRLKQTNRDGSNSYLPAGNGSATEVGITGGPPG